MHMEWGSFDGSDNWWVAPSVLVKEKREVILFVGISSTTNPDWAKVFKKCRGIHFELLDDQEHGAMPFKTHVDYIPAGETPEAKALRKREEVSITLEKRAPHYSFFHKDGGYVNPHSKPFEVYRDIISIFFV